MTSAEVLESDRHGGPTRYEADCDLVGQVLDAWIRSARGFRGHESWGLRPTKPAPGIDRVRYLLLRELVHGPRRRLTDLADRMSVTPSHLSRVVDDLVQRGLVTRVVPAGDRRVTLIEATAPAHEVMAAVDADSREHIARRLRAFTSDEAEHFSDLFDRFASEVERWADVEQPHLGVRTRTRTDPKPDLG